MNRDEEQNLEQLNDGQPLLSIEEQRLCRRALNRMHVPKPDVDAEWERLALRTQSRSRGTGKRNRWLLVGFVSGVAATLLVCVWFFSSPEAVVRQDEPLQVFAATQNVDDVVLTSDKGDTHVVTADCDSLLAQKGIEVTGEQLNYRNVRADAAIQWMTLTTPRGKDYHVTLSDGTQVWMNADSKLEFPEVFDGERRVVRLHGEAYFEVAKDASHPFEVQSDWFVTSVLGTEFNVRTYTRQEASVVLVNGKVALQDVRDSTKTLTLTPGQKAKLAESDGFWVENVDVYGYSQWKDGYFYFDNVALEEILHELGRWYNVDIVIENPAKVNERLHYVADRHQPLDLALQTLNALEVVTVEWTGNKVVIR